MSQVAKVDIEVIGAVCTPAVVMTPPTDPVVPVVIKQSSSGLGLGPRHRVGVQAETPPLMVVTSKTMLLFVTIIFGEEAPLGKVSIKAKHCALPPVPVGIALVPGDNVVLVPN